LQKIVVFSETREKKKKKKEEKSKPHNRPLAQKNEKQQLKKTFLHVLFLHHPPFPLPLNLFFFLQR
jgi:hypothetical protein